MTKIIEIARFRVRPGREDNLVREHGNALTAIQRAFPGLLQARLMHLGGDVWADVAEWTDEHTAAAAVQGAMSVPEFALWTRYILEDLSLDHGVVQSAVERRDVVKGHEFTSDWMQDPRSCKQSCTDEPLFE